MSAKAKKQRAKPNRQKHAAAIRYRKFVSAYVANGQNGTQAAIAAGYSKKTAAQIATRLLNTAQVRDRLADEVERSVRITGLEGERTLRALARVTYQDPVKFYRPDGSFKPPGEWDADMAGAVASIEHDDKGRIRKIRFNDRNAALKTALQYHGLLIERREDLTPPKDPEFEAKRKQVVDRLYSYLDEKARGLHRDGPKLIEILQPQAAAELPQSRQNPGGNGANGHAQGNGSRPPLNGKNGKNGG